MLARRARCVIRLLGFWVWGLGGSDLVNRQRGWWRDVLWRKSRLPHARNSGVD